jgi:hypothetical protein
MARGEQATSETFRFNPAKQEVIFPPKHPYRRVQQIVQENLTEHKELLKKQRKDVLEYAKTNVVGKTARHPAIEEDIHFTTTGIKEALNQPHEYYLQKNEAIRDIKERIEKGDLIQKAKIDKERKLKFYYIKTVINSGNSYINLKKQVDEKGVGTKGSRLTFYTITDSIK